MADLTTVQQLIGKLSVKEKIKGELKIPPYREIDAYEGDYLVTPSTSEITLETAGKKAVADIIIEPMPSGSVGNASVSRTKTESALVTEISFPEFDDGYIASMSSVSTSQTLEEVTVTPTEETQTFTPASNAHYLNSVTVMGITLQDKTVTPLEESQSIEAGTGYDALGTVTVEAIDSDYIGSGITQRDSADLTSSGATVTAPSGYYEEDAEFTVPSGTISEIVAVKGQVSNHGISVTPSVSIASGWIADSTETGDSVTVNASELVSGTKTIIENGTDIDVTDYAYVDVAVPTSGATLQTKSVTYTPSKIQQTDTVEPDSGYDGLDAVNVTINAMQMADVTSGLRTTFYTENNARKWSAFHNAYAEREGWVDIGEQDSATKVFNAIPENTSVTPTESAQTIGGSQYMMEGAVTVNAIPSSYVGSGITRRTSQDMQFGDNYTIVAPNGYYQNNASVNIPAYAHQNPYITFDSDTGLIVAEHGAILNAIVYGEIFTRDQLQLTVGNNLEYGLTDGTLPLVGVAKIGEAVLFETSPLIGTAQAGYTTVV